jgi:MFS family permease
MAPSTEIAAARPSPLAAFASRDFRFYAGARFLATVASQMQLVAVGFQIYALTHRPMALGYVGLAQFVPVVLLSLVTGQAADRFDRRALFLACEGLYAVCSLAFFALSRSASPSPTAFYAVLVGCGVARAFSGPAGSSLMPSLVPREHLANAVSWQTTLWQLAAISGPSLGGLVYGIFASPVPVYIASTAGFACAAILVVGIRTRTGRMEKRPPSIANALEGLRFVWAKKMLLGSISLDFFAVFLGGAVALLPVYATDVLHVGATGLGLLRSAPAAGAGLMAVYLAFRPLQRAAGAKMLACVGLFGAATVVFGVSTSFGLSLCALATLGAADMVSVVVRMTMEQAATPSAMRGRVSAVNQVFIGASNELGEFESGVAAAWLGAVPAVIAGGVGTLVVVALWSVLFPEIRKVDRLEDIHSE